MGFLAGEVIRSILAEVEDADVRRRIYVRLVEAASTFDECQGVDDVFDEVFHGRARGAKPYSSPPTGTLGPRPLRGAWGDA
jgi:hypothetical protein